MLNFLVNSTYERAQQASAAQPGWWVHWHYTEAEWQSWRASDWLRTRQAYHRWWLGAAGVVALLAAVTGVLVLTGRFGAGWPALVLITWVLGIGFGANWLFWLLGPYAKAKRLHALRQRGPREIAIQPLWLWQAGEGAPLIQAMHALQWVYLRGENPAILAFRLANRNRRNQMYEVWVPVPAGYVAEAQQLVERFKQEIIRKPGHRSPAPVVASAPVGGDTIRFAPLTGATPEPETQRLP